MAAYKAVLDKLEYLRPTLVCLFPKVLIPDEQLKLNMTQTKELTERTRKIGTLRRHLSDWRFPISFKDADTRSLRESLTKPLGVTVALDMNRSLTRLLTA